LKDSEIQKLADYEEENWWFVGRRKIVSNFIMKYFKINPNLKILDAGSGTGKTTNYFKQIGDVHGIERSSTGVIHCNKLGLKIVQGHLNYLPFAANTFDIITLLDVLEHIENDLEMLKKLKPLLKPNGKLIITVPAYQLLWTEHDIALSHFRRYTAKTLESVLKKADFQISRTSYFITALLPLIFSYKILLKFKKSKNNPQSHSHQFPEIINTMLQKIILFESKFLKKINFPFGASVICVASIKNKSQK
jgi:SAM-dependent methyltransferase